VGDEKATHPFARLSIGQAVMHTAVAWQSTSPMWDEKLAFKCAALNPLSLVLPSA
jgi:C2 domain